MNVRPDLDAAVVAEAPKRSRLRRRAATGGLGSDRVLLGIALLLAGAIVVIAVLGPLFAEPPTRIRLDLKFVPPSGDAWFGTDDLGRDLFSRVAHGTRGSIISAVAIVAIAAVIGILIGSVAGYVGGRIEEWLMRLTDMVMAFPYLILAMAIATILGPSLRNAVLSLTIVWWPSYARLIRGQVLVQKQSTFVTAARALGLPGWKILLKHVIPHSWAPLQTKILVDFGFAIIAISSLSFVGLGAQPPTPELGAMIFEARYHLLEAWWYGVFPGLAMFAAAVSANLLGDILQDRLEGRPRA